MKNKNDGFLGPATMTKVVFLILLGIKLTGYGLYGNISWWWVFSPVILSFVIFTLDYFANKKDE